MTTVLCSGTNTSSATTLSEPEPRSPALNQVSMIASSAVGTRKSRYSAGWSWWPGTMPPSMIQSA